MWSPVTLTGSNYYTTTVYCNSEGLRCSGCRITVWIVSSNSALLYRRSHSISHSNEIPLPQTLRMQYATLDRTVDIVCAVSICKGLVVGLCSSGVQNFDVSIDYRVCCVCSALLQSWLFCAVELLHVSVSLKANTDWWCVAFPHFIIKDTLM